MSGRVNPNYTYLKVNIEGMGDSMSQTVRHCFRILYIQSPKPPDLPTVGTRTQNRTALLDGTKIKEVISFLVTETVPAANLMDKHFRGA